MSKKYNWQENLAILKSDRHVYIRISTEAQCRQLVDYLEWLLPYKCEQSKERVFKEASDKLRVDTHAYINIFGLAYHDGIKRVTTMNASVLFSPPCKSLEVHDFDEFKQPLYTALERNDSLISEEHKRFLKSLSRQ